MTNLYLKPAVSIMVAFMQVQVCAAANTVNALDSLPPGVTYQEPSIPDVLIPYVPHGDEPQTPENPIPYVPFTDDEFTGIEVPVSWHPIDTHELDPEGYVPAPELFPYVPEGYVPAPELFPYVPEGYVPAPELFPYVPEGYLPAPELVPYDPEGGETVSFEIPESAYPVDPYELDDETVSFEIPESAYPVDPYELDDETVSFEIPESAYPIDTYELADKGESIEIPESLYPTHPYEPPNAGESIEIPESLYPTHPFELPVVDACDGYRPLDDSVLVHYGDDGIFIGNVNLPNGGEGIDFSDNNLDCDTDLPPTPVPDVFCNGFRPHVYNESGDGIVHYGNDGIAMEEGVLRYGDDGIDFDYPDCPREEPESNDLAWLQVIYMLLLSDDDQPLSGEDLPFVTQGVLAAGE